MDIESMSAEQIRREIARRRGWHDFSTDTGVLTGWQGDYYLPVPDFSTDTGAALALCLEIAAERNLEVTICPYPGFFSCAFLHAGDDTGLFYDSAPTPALALARLALLAHIDALEAAVQQAATIRLGTLY